LEELTANAALLLNSSGQSSTPFVDDNDNQAVTKESGEEPDEELLRLSSEWLLRELFKQQGKGTVSL
jgi:hypothetical protein